MDTNYITFDKVNKPSGWLGNMSPFPIKFNGEVWRTSEALFQALRFDDLSVREIIRNEKSPMAAKMKAKRFKHLMVIEPMSDADVENMRLCLRLKLEQHPLIRSLLKGTGDKTIIEDIGKRNGERHLFWGAKLVNGQWSGTNTMGKLWMELRKDIK